MTITRRITAWVECDRSGCESTVKLFHVTQFDNRGAGDKSAGPTIQSLRALAREQGWTMGSPHSLDCCPHH